VFAILNVSIYPSVFGVIALEVSLDSDTCFTGMKVFPFTSIGFRFTLATGSKFYPLILMIGGVVLTGAPS